MIPSSQIYWDEKLVMAFLRQAASIHRRLPEVRVTGYRSLWPETVKDEWERFYDAIHGKGRLRSPMPPEVTFHEAVMEWLRWINRREQQIVWMRANQIPWKILIEEFGRSKPTLWREMNAALSSITTKLNAEDPRGEATQQLWRQANCPA